MANADLHDGIILQAAGHGRLAAGYGVEGGVGALRTVQSGPL